MRKKISEIFFIFFAICFLPGCGKQDEAADLRHYVDNLKHQPLKQESLLQQFHWDTDIVYNGQNLRSPFPQQSMMGDAKLLALLPLERYPLDALHLVGIVQEDDAQYAVLLAPDGKIYQVQVGDIIGNNHGRVSAITERQVTIDEPVVTESGTSMHKVELRLKDK